jgi:hypothetical protein
MNMYDDFIDEKKSVRFYNQKKLPAQKGRTLIDFHLSGCWDTEESERRFCRGYTPASHGMAAAHPLREILPAAYALDIGAIAKLNILYPGIIYDMPRIAEHIKKLTVAAMRSADTAKALAARSDLKRLSCPVKVGRESMPLSSHACAVVTLVAQDFAFVRALFKSETRNADKLDVYDALCRTFRDIPRKWITDICIRGARPVVLAADRAGELLGWKGGRGLYNAWLAEGPCKHPHAATQMQAHARAAAARIELVY